MSALLLFSGVALLTTLSPGPAVLFTIHNTLTAGARAAWRGALGNATGLLLLAAAGFAGVSVLLSQSVLAFTVLKVAGSAYLIYLAFHQWRQARDLTALTVAAAPAQKRLYWQGVLVALTNPKAWLFISALLPQFLDITQPITQQFALLALVFAASSLLSHACWLSLARFGLARGPLVKHRQLLARLQAVVLAVIGGSLWWTPLPV